MKWHDCPKNTLSLALLLWIPAVLAVTPAHPELFPFHHSPVGCLRFILASLIHTLIGIPMHEEDFALGMERLQCMILPAYFPLAGFFRGDLEPGVVTDLSHFQFVTIIAGMQFMQLKQERPMRREKGKKGKTCCQS